MIEQLAAEYPQLYLNPDADTQDSYKRVTLKGEEPENKDLSHFTGDCSDRMETADTPVGSVRVVTVGNRHDFELIARGLMAAKDGPLAEIPESQGAAMFTVFNWRRIRAHLEQFPVGERQAAFQKFTSVKENYMDMLVVLSRGPYSNVDAASLGYSESEWLDISDTIRRYHELTHVICRRRYPDDIDPVRDELVADAVGLYAAYGTFDPEMEKKFLGISENKYTGGRLGNYTEKPELLAGAVCHCLEGMRKVAQAHPGEEPFALIEFFQKACLQMQP